MFDATLICRSLPQMNSEKEQIYTLEEAEYYQLTGLVKLIKEASPVVPAVKQKEFIGIRLYESSSVLDQKRAVSKSEYEMVEMLNQGWHFEAQARIQGCSKSVCVLSREKTS
jgi:hypothetical protein